MPLEKDALRLFLIGSKQSAPCGCPHDHNLQTKHKILQLVYSDGQSAWLYFKHG